MEPLEEDDDADGSVLALISGLCHSISRNARNLDAEEYEQLQRRLRRTAFSHLLKHASNVIEENRSFTENIPLAIFILVVSKKVASHTWNQSEYEAASRFLDDIERQFNRPTLPSWVWGMARMFIALELNRPPPAAGAIQDPSMAGGFRRLGDMSCIPKPFRLSRSHFLDYDFREGLTPYDFLWTHMRKRIDTLKLPMMIGSLHGGRSNLHSIESPRPVMPRSDSRVDEGFLSPSNAVTPRKFDWKDVPLEPKKPFREWESFSMRPSERYERGRAHCDLKFCPTGLVKVPTDELFECVKALLVGVSSHLFNEVNGEFGMLPGLYTDATPPDLMFVYCKTFRKGGELFLKLTEYTEYYNCLTSASMSVTIQNFILDYQMFVSSLLPSRSLLELCLGITSYIDQVEYIVRLVDGDLSGWRLLEQLYNDFHRMVDPKLSILASALFIDSYSTYLQFIENWIYNGVWHHELFFKKHLELEDINDKYTWNHCYTFDPQDAPSFIPAAEIYECGKLVLLLADDNILEEGNTLTDCRPKLRLVTTEDELTLLKNVCLFYSHTGDQLLLEALEKYDNNLDLVVAAREKAEADSLKYKMEKSAEDKAKLHQKLQKIIEGKRLLDTFKANQNSRELKESLQQLLEDDRSIYLEIEKMLSTFPLRMELVEQYFRNEERCIKRFILNRWKEKRHDLDIIRARNFEESFGNDSPAIFKHRPPSPSSTLNEEASKATSCTSQSSLVDTTSVKNPPSSSTSDADTVYQSIATTYHEVGNDKDSHSDISSSLYFTCSERPNSRSNPCHSSTGDLSNIKEVSSEDENIFEIEEQYTFASGDTSNTSSLPSASRSNKSSEVQIETEKITECLPSTLQSSRSSETQNEPVDQVTESLPSTSRSNKSSEIQKETEKVTETLPSTSKSPVPPRESQIHKEPMHMLVDRINQNLSQKAQTDAFKPLQYITNYFSRNAAQNSMEPPEKSPEKENLLMTTFDKTLLNYLISKSIEYPLRAQIKVVKNLAVHKLFVENDLIGRLISLRDVFLKYDGVGGRVFVSMLAKQIETDDPQAFSVHHKLRNIMNVAYPQNSRFFSLRAEGVPHAFDSTKPDIFGFLKLFYKVKWPLNLVITEMALLKYQEMSEFLLRIDLTLLHLQKVFNFLRLKYLDVISEDFTQISLHRHKMHSFVNSLKYFTGSVIADCWKKMHDKLLIAHDPDYIYNTHVRFLKNLHIKLLLRKNTERFQECLCKTLHYIIVYCQTVIYNDFQTSSAGLPYHPRSKKLIHTFSNFQEMAAACKKMLDYFVKEHGFIHLTILSQMMDI